MKKVAHTRGVTPDLRPKLQQARQDCKLALASNRYFPDPGASIHPGASIRRKKDKYRI